MYEPNDPPSNFVCQLRTLDNEIIAPEFGGRMLMAAPYFPPFHRGARNVRLRQTRPTLHMLIQRRLRANEDRSAN
jgi:hypothetical protein